MIIIGNDLVHRSFVERIIRAKDIVKEFASVGLRGLTLITGVGMAVGCQCSDRAVSLHNQIPDAGMPNKPDMGTNKDATPDSYRKADASPDVSSDAILDGGADASPDGPVITNTLSIQPLLIGDFIDRELGDRGRSLNNGYSFSTPETAPDANPFSNGVGNALATDLEQTQLHRIDGSMFPPFADSSTSDPEAAGWVYSQEQNLWLWGNDSYSDTADDVVADLRGIVYTTRVSNETNEFGIAVCTTPTFPLLFASCIEPGGNVDAKLDNATANHRVKIKFMGEDWIITDMQPPTTALTNETQLVSGGSIKIGKELAYGVINLGEWIEVNGYKLVLKDVKNNPDGNEAVIDIIDPDGNLVSTETFIKGIAKPLELDNPSIGKALKVVNGFTFGAKWATIIVFSSELELISGQRLNPNVGDNNEWKVVLGWKNRGASATDTVPDHLRTAIVYTTDLQALLASELYPGDYVPIPQKPEMLRVMYNGLNLFAGNRDALRFQLERNLDRRNMDVRNGTSDLLCDVIAPYVLVTSATSNSFQLSAGGMTGIGNQLYVATNGLECVDTSGFPVTYGPNSILIPNIGSIDIWRVRPYGTGPLPSPIDVGYKVAGGIGNTWNTGGVITVAGPEHANPISLPGTDFDGLQIPDLRTVLALSETAGVGLSADTVDRILFGLKQGATAADWTFSLNAAGIFEPDTIRYYPAGPVSIGAGTQREGYISERGSSVSLAMPTLVEIEAARRVIDLSLELQKIE